MEQAGIFLWGIVNAMTLRTTNAGSESVNSKVQRVKRAACGVRNHERFRNAILSISAASTSIPSVFQLPTQLPDAPSCCCAVAPETEDWSRYGRHQASTVAP